jgi:hypothetical protein
VLLRDDERLDGNGAAGARYRFVASTETWAEANALMERVYKAIEAREL